MTKNKTTLKTLGLVMLITFCLGSCKLFKKDCDCPTWSKKSEIKKESQEELV